MRPCLCKTVLAKNAIIRQLFCVVLALGFAAPCFAQESATDVDKRLTADVLKTTLLARTAEERRFCDYVINKRDDGTIPSRLIYAVYQKARAQDRNRRFVYFKTGLETLCKREGIVLNSIAVQTTPTAPSFISPKVMGLFQRNGL